MNKKHSVRVPVTEQMLKELRRKSQAEDIEITDITRKFWDKWIAGKIKYDLLMDDQSEAA